jgi:hypothetical protein
MGGTMLDAKQALELTKDPLRVIAFPMKKCVWAIEKAIVKRKREACVYGGFFGGAKIEPPRAGYKKVEDELVELGFKVAPIGGFFRPGIKIEW